MARMALYRSWRPRRFDELIGQEAACDTLRQAIRTDEIAHAYLFCGTRGTGKTSMAKILARAVNCLEPDEGNPCNHCEICQAALEGSLLDIQEIDAASNNSVDNIRRLIDEVQYLPTRARYKVYIIDEVHMLSSGAFNALLKTLEEPPKHVIFILATTEVQRIPATIRSRCQRFDFRRISPELMHKRLAQIAKAEGIRISEACLAEIATRSDGALRDAISLLDQCQMSFPEGCELEDLLRLLGSTDSSFFLELAEDLLALDVTGLMSALDTVQAEGRDLTVFCSEAAAFFRDLLLAHEVGGETSLLRILEGDKARFYSLAERYSSGALQFCLKRLQQLLAELKWAPQKRISVDLAFLSILASFREQYRRKGLSGGRTEQPAKAERPAKAEQPTKAEQPAKAERPTKAEQPTKAEPEAAPRPQAPEAPSMPELEPPPEELNTPERTEPVSQEPEPQPAPSPTNLAEALAQLARAQQPAGAAPRPSQTEQPSQTAPRPRLKNREEIRALWNDFLQQLNAEDSYCYYMLRQGRVRVEQGQIRIYFTGEQANLYRALREAQLQQNLLRRWRPYESKSGLGLGLIGPEEETQTEGPQTETDWQERIRSVSRELDIPVEELE